MSGLKQKLTLAITFIKQIDKDYLKEKWHQLRNLKREDIISFVTYHRKKILYAFLAFVGVMVAIPIFTYFYFARDLRSKETIIHKKNEGVVLLDRNERPFFTLFDAKTTTPVTYDEIPEKTREAFVAIEDKDFYTHPGFSISGFARAIKENILSESYAQGGSTISQQLMKNTLLSQQKALLRKYQELVLAIELERRYSKHDILEMYLNTIYFGEGAFGIQDASQRYFSKDVKDLTLSESALLAAIIQAPSALSPISGNEQAALKRRNLVLKLMLDQGYITKDEETAAQKEKIKLNPTKDDINEDGVHFALMIQDLLIKEYGEQSVANSGYVVKTTIDLDLQRAAQKAVADQVKRLASNKVTNGAAIAEDPKTGEILALVGSHDYADDKNGRINMALRPRQPGSSFKPLIYAKAIEERKITASTQLDDEPVKFGTYEPLDYDRKFRGKVLARYALANSLNIPAVHVLDMIGVKAGVEQAKDMGITTLSNEKDYGLPLVLGAAEVPLIEMTNAYSVFADEGTWHKNQIFLEIRDKNGKVILEPSTETRQVMPSSVAYIISSILSDNEARQDTFGGSLTISRKAAVKTGTTNDYRDSLTLGYTPQVVVGVWIGNNDNTPMSSVAGSSGAGPIWRQIMESYLKGKELVDFEKPGTIVDETVCREDGKKLELAENQATTSAFLEYFLRGTAPTEMCGIVPTPTPTLTDDQKKQQDEENKKREEEEKQKDATATPAPTNTPAPTATSAPIVTIFITPTSGPTNTPSAPTATPTNIVPTL
jgi:1A family penicillin-binding protein